MRRSPLARKSPLRARATLRRRPKRQPETPVERDARMQWADWEQGGCACGACGGRFSLRLERHHVIGKAKLKEIGRCDELWNLSNAMLLHPDCHERHTNHSRKVRIEFVPVAALAFAVDVLGEGGAAAYLHAHYDCTVTL